MFSVHGKIVTVCCMRRCLVANCPIVEHQRRRRLGHQQLRTAIGEHSADRRRRLDGISDKRRRSAARYDGTVPFSEW